MAGDDRTVADRLGALRLTATMPHFRWHRMRPFCVTCEWRTRHRRDGERWPEFDRDQLRALGAEELHCEFGSIVLVMPFDLFDWNKRGGCLLHEVVPEWDDAQIAGRSFGVQDFSTFSREHFKPLDYFSHSKERDW